MGVPKVKVPMVRELPGDLSTVAINKADNFQTSEVNQFSFKSLNFVKIPHENQSLRNEGSIESSTEEIGNVSGISSKMRDCNTLPCTVNGERKERHDGNFSVMYRSSTRDDNEIESITKDAGDLHNNDAEYLGREAALDGMNESKILKAIGFGVKLLIKRVTARIMRGIREAKIFVLKLI